QRYVAHIFLFVIFTAEVSYIVQRFNNPMYNDELRVGDFLAEPHVAIIKTLLLLQFQPTFLDILPLYIVLLAVFPLVLLAQRVSLLLPLARPFSSTPSSHGSVCRCTAIRPAISGSSTHSPGSSCS